MPEGGMYDHIFEQDIRKIDVLILCSVDSVSKIEILKKKVRNWIINEISRIIMNNQWDIMND